MAKITRQNSDIAIEVDERGKFRMYVAGVLIPSISIETESETRTNGVVLVAIPAGLVTFRSVKSSAKIAPSGEVI